MKIPELKKLLENVDRTMLEKVLVECYKQVPKAKKEELDLVIQDVLEGKSEKRGKVPKSVDFETLSGQIETFLENAYAQNYLVPNRSVPKNQRSKWRFLVKGYIKEMAEISPENEHYAEAVGLLGDLYRMVCYACNYYLFSTDDPFRSIGWEQPALYRLLAEKTLQTGNSREAIAELIADAVSGGLSRESLHCYQELTLLSLLTTDELKSAAIEEAKRLAENEMTKLKSLGEYSHERYETQERVNELCNFILAASMELGKTEEGVKYYFEHCREHTREIVLYCALDMARMMDFREDWLYIYEYGLKKKIKPREELREQYEQILREGR